MPRKKGRRPFRRILSPPAPITRDDSRTGEEYIREWIASLSSIYRAEVITELSHGHMYLWLTEPIRRFNPDDTLRIARAANCPTEAIQYRDVPIRDLDFWRFVEAVPAKKPKTKKEEAA